MKNWLLDSDHLKRASGYLVVALLSLLIACFVLKLWRADLRVPLHYNGDALLHAMFIRGIVDNGWYLQNPSLGMPSGLKMYDFPAVDNSAGVILWIISLFNKNAIVVLNIFYLLTFPLIAISSLFVLRQLQFSYLTSAFCSLLYTFLPYHFMRDESHLFLSAYYFIPLVVLALLWITSDKLFSKTEGQDKSKFNPRKKEFLVSVVACVLIGSSGIYYPFFSCFLLLVAGIAGTINLKMFRPLAISALLILVTTLVLLVNLSPTLIKIYREGNAGVTTRSLAGPEIYGLKVSQLLLPVTGHRIGSLKGLKQLYNEGTQLTENDAAALGVIGAIGFLALIAQLFYRRRDGLLADLSILNIFAVLLGTIGGLGSLFALFVSAGIRSYNRISVFIAFFSLLAVGIGLERLRQKLPALRNQIIFGVMLSFALLVGVMDQTTKGFVPDYAGIKAEFFNDDDFVRNIEVSLPPGAMVFQLPYVPFPEHPHVHQMVDYDLLRGYLHSRALRWSYGAMKNREGDLWQQQVVARPAEEFLQTLAFSGFGGIYLDRHGYEDKGAAKEAELSKVLQIQPAVSANNRLSFFSLSGYTARLRTQYSDTDWQAKQEASLHPLILDWVGGFSGLESGNGRTWRWCSYEGELRLVNTSSKPRKVMVEMYLVSGYEQSEDLFISGLISEQLKTTLTPVFYSKTFTVPLGHSTIRFSSRAKPVDAPLDPRVLVFRVENFSLKELE